MAGESARLRALKARERSARLTEYADRYERGADGEAATAAVLDDLGGPWHRLDDVHWPGRPYANIDHILIGPPGVFVIDTKNWSGNLDIGPNKIRQNGRSRQQALDGIQLAAREVAQLVEPAVQAMPVLCFVREVAIRGMVGKVMVCSTINIVSRLEAMAPVLNDSEVRSIADRLVSSLPPSTEPSTPDVRGDATVRAPKSAGQAAPKALHLVPKLIACGILAAGGVYLVSHVDDFLPSAETAQHDPPANGVKPGDKDASLNEAP